MSEDDCIVDYQEAGLRVQHHQNVVGRHAHLFRTEELLSSEP
jgi:hypothetical protein